MSDYCQVPPYVKTGVKPNIMVLIDNSNDMWDSAHIGDYLNEPFTDSNGNGSYDAGENYRDLNNSGSWDANEPTVRYIGLFDPDKYYSYASNVFVEDPGGTFDGNLLNWATMSKYDVLLKVLIGGNSTSKQGNAHTLASISGSWTKTYGGCTYEVNSANVTITGAGCGDGSGGGGGPCDTPDNPYPAAPAEDPDFPRSRDIGKNNKDPKFTTSSITDATVNNCYTFAIEATWGEPLPTEYTYTITADALPTGLALHDISGIIHGLPTVEETQPFTVEVKDASGRTASKAFTLTVAAGGGAASSSHRVKVDLNEEDIINDVNLNDSYDSDVDDSFIDSDGDGEWDGKHGVFHRYWDGRPGYESARWGSTAYGNSGVEVDNCMPPNNTSTWFTSFQNIQPELTSPLADGLYGIINHISQGFLDVPAHYNVNSIKASGCADPLDAKNCRTTNVLILTSGNDVGNSSFPSLAPCQQADPLVLDACYGQNHDIRTDKDGTQRVNTYIVNTFGDQNTDVLKNAAKAGGGNFYDADDSNLEQAITNALEDILKRAASGTAASVLASGEGSGANLIQAVFYPKRKFDNPSTGVYDEIGWTGNLTNLWYYVDPLFARSSIRNDRNSHNTLNLGNDEIVRLYYDFTEEKTKAYLCTEDVNGNLVCPANSVDFEDPSLEPIWRAGEALWGTPADSRTIYTNNNGSRKLFESTDATAGLLQSDLQASDLAEAKKIIEYVRGKEDFDGDGETDAGLRSRMVYVGGTKDVWKLGDIINSTPRLASWVALSTYQKTYNDDTYGMPGQDAFESDPSDENYFITKELTNGKYKKRGMVYVGANDGMLHAFKLGSLKLDWPLKGAGDVATLEPPSTGGQSGEEAWAFIPRNALPYLKNLMDPNGCHIYTVDMSPYIFDASIGRVAGNTRDEDDWRTVLIGGMRYGGACSNACGTADCVQTPLANLGYSSYFALDVTEEDNPKVLWEYAAEGLGFSTPGPAVVRIGPEDETGEWYVVLASGPTGPIVDGQFKGRSDQELKLHILNLRGTGGGQPVIERVMPTGITDAFAGSMINATNDSDLDYSDDAVYIPYVQKKGAEWNSGGVLRLLTNEKSPGFWPNPVAVISGVGPVTSGVGRLQDQKKGELWLYFGTGRFFFDTPIDKDDPTSIQQLYGIKDPCFNSIMGMVPGCTDKNSDMAAPLIDVTDVNNAPNDASGIRGWYINLEPDGLYPYLEDVIPGDPASGVVRSKNYNAERVITDPLASTIGVVFFTTYKPYNEECLLGGKSFIWFVKHNTGGAPQALLKGKGLIQVGTGSIEEIDLTDSGSQTGCRKSAAVEGVPPTAQGLSIITTPPPVDRIIHKRVK